MLGVEAIEYVGHTIDGEGMHFYRENLSEVAQYPTPINAKQLRSFLGLAQYFAPRRKLRAMGRAHASGAHHV